MFGFRKTRKSFLKINTSNAGIFFGLLIFLLTFFGFIMLSSASLSLGEARFNDSWYYLKHQALSGLPMGLFGFFFMYFLAGEWLKKAAFPIFLLSVGFLVLVFTPLGINAGGAERWVNLQFFSFQPSELLKISLVLYVAAWLSSALRKREEDFFKGFVPFILILSFVGGMLLLQPATSTAVILLSTAFLMYFISGAKIRYILVLGGLGVTVLAGTIYLTPYKWKRFETYLNPAQNQSSSSFHINQTIKAVSSGHFFGVGYGQSTTKLKYLPEPMGDSIFAILAEEFGFFGVAVIIFAYLLILLMCFYFAYRETDQFFRLLFAGYGWLIGFQAFVNIAAISGVIPLTGAPLPFVSYGGTALVVNLTISGILAGLMRKV